MERHQRPSSSYSPLPAETYIIHHTVEDLTHFTDLTGYSCSSSRKIHNLTWTIQVRISDQDMLSFFLCCNTESLSRNWSCNVRAEFRILSQISIHKDYVRTAEHLYHHAGNTWGFSEFLSKKIVMDPIKGFHDSSADRITLQVKMMAEVPHGTGCLEDSREETVIKYKVKDFKKMTIPQTSHPRTARNLPWRVAVKPSNDGQACPFGLFLQCKPELNAGSWSCEVAAHLAVLGLKQFGEPFVKKIQHTFNSQENESGFPAFMNQQELEETTHGYYNQERDSITVEVRLKAQIPHGVAGPWGFRRSMSVINQYTQTATTQVETDELFSLIRCSVCLESFTDPRMLVCQHSFCFACLQALVSRRPKSIRLKCPLCRRVCLIPQAGIIKLPKNILLNNLHSMLNKGESKED